MSQPIHTPYHFVPLSKWVYMPEWAHLVSHDVPFSDGHSGVIEYQLENKTPLCVGDSKDEQNRLKFATNPLGQPIIPGSSIKGMLRSVLEIAGFGKFSSFDDRRLSFRDISSSRSNYLTNVINPNKVQSGWIRYDHQKEVWLFTECHHAKVKHSDVEKVVRKPVKNEYSAIKKYQLCPLRQSVSATISSPKGKQQNRWAENLGQGHEAGYLVFTNQRIAGRGKQENYEFSYYFYNRDTSEKSVEVSKQARDLFENHTSVTDTVNGRTFNQVDYLKQHAHPEFGIPVFALKKGASIHSLGFAKMPRVTYRHSLQEMVENTSKAHTSDAYYDLAELMFGTLREEGLGLKSRISFTDANATNRTNSDLYYSNLLILNNPKPSFHPAYVEQRHNETQYKDYDSKDGTLSGHKRYIAKAPLDNKLESNAKENLNVAQSIQLCPSNSTFTGKIVFHNLKTVELSALLWILELQDSYHQLGHGKPMGAGVVKITPKIEVLQSSKQLDIAIDSKLFVEHMNNCYPSDDENAWLRSPQLEYLSAIGRFGDHDHLDTHYMSIDNKDYQRAKNANAKLEPLNGLSRSEPVSLNKTHSSTAFGRGRLARLIGDQDPWTTEQKTAAKKQQDSETEKQRQIEKAQLDAHRKASLTKLQLSLAELDDKIHSADATERPPMLRETMTLFLSSPDKNEAVAAMSLYQLARKYEYHKKPKKRIKEQKAQLTELATQFGLQV
ncbi:TIGR03986 family CRISPR-associated RAMP protein [Vibrio breoganii]